MLSEMFLQEREGAVYARPRGAYLRCPCFQSATD